MNIQPQLTLSVTGKIKILLDYEYCIIYNNTETVILFKGKRILSYLHTDICSHLETTSKTYLLYKNSYERHCKYKKPLYINKTIAIKNNLNYIIFITAIKGAFEVLKPKIL